MKKLPVTGICKLCQKEKVLIGRSHIWPDFMYKGMHDEKGRLIVVNSESPFRRRYAQSGAYQKHIFCEECDNVRIGRLERYASNHLYRQAYLKDNLDFKRIKVNGMMEIIECQRLDYNTFKLFLLSLLWRASISTEAIFEHFKLPAADEEFLRSCLYNESVVDEMVFPCVLMTAEGLDPEENYIAVDPFRAGMVKFYINQFVYTYYLAENKKDDTVKRLIIGMDQKMGIMKVSLKNWNMIRASVAQAAVKAVRNDTSN